MCQVGGKELERDRGKSSLLDGFVSPSHSDFQDMPESLPWFHRLS